MEERFFFLTFLVILTQASPTHVHKTHTRLAFRDSKGESKGWGLTAT